MSHKWSILGVASVSFWLGCGADGGVGIPTADPHSRYCTLAGCFDAVSLDQTFAVGTADLQTLSLTVCRNDQCEALAVKWSDVRPDSYDCRGIGRYQCSLIHKKKDGTLWLQLVFVVPPGDVAERYFQDGDRYRVSVTAAEKETLFSIDQTVTYHRFYPNGPQCDPGCKGAALRPL